jgi:3-hydroxyisobutyrate dehydrogenase-like beta-hydroxyacid dehydrogenase
MADTARPCSIAVLGLGPMGVAIAGATSRAGHHVTAWNRTPRTPTEHGLDASPGVVLASTPEQAAAGADVIVICVRDHRASRQLLRTVSPVVGRAVVVDVSTGTPAQTIESATEASGLGVRYVTGAVMVPTSMVGGPESLALYAGAPLDIDDLAPFFEAMAGVSDVLGEDHGVPPALDLAMLDVYFAGMYAFLHSAALAEAHGVDPARYLPYAEGIIDTLRGTIPELTTAIQQRTYDSGEARLDMCLGFLEHIVTTSDDVGLRPGIAALVRDASAAALERWPGATDWDVVAEDLRPTPSPS